METVLIIINIIIINYITPGKVYIVKYLDRTIDGKLKNKYSINNFFLYIS